MSDESRVEAIPSDADAESKQPGTIGGQPRHPAMPRNEKWYSLRESKLVANNQAPLVTNPGLMW